jgi:hypothetical protein
LVDIDVDVDIEKYLEKLNAIEKTLYKYMMMKNAKTLRYGLRILVICLITRIYYENIIVIFIIICFEASLRLY